MIVADVMCKINRSPNGYKSLSEPHEYKPYSEPLSIFMLGFDSVSRVDWPNLLPKSTRTLMDLGTVVLNGYNIVGDGTPAALIPILTSKMEHELPNTLRNTIDAHYVDKVYPFLWTNFSEQLGYETMFAEDYPSVGTFQYRMKGMSRPPVPHYMRYT